MTKVYGDKAHRKESKLTTTRTPLGSSVRVATVTRKQQRHVYREETSETVGVPVEDLVSVRWTKETRSKFDPARISSPFESESPSIIAAPAKVKSDDVKYSLAGAKRQQEWRVSEKTTGVSEEELGPGLKELCEYFTSRFEWGDGWVNVTDADGTVIGIGG